MYLVDTHCHLNIDNFKDDIDEVIERSIQSGIERIIVPGLDRITSIRAIELSLKYSNIYACVGIHPNEVENINNTDLHEIEQLSKENKVIAIGEIGLDYYHNNESRNKQILILENMLDLSIKVRKPIILHSREALSDLIAIIDKYKPLFSLTNHGVFHAFEGTQDQAKEVISSGFLIGIGGPVTYKNANQKREIVKSIKVENIVLETDAPFLTPHPFRGKRNEPAYLIEICKKISEIITQPFTTVASITTNNAQKLFQLD